MAFHREFPWIIELDEMNIADLSLARGNIHASCWRRLRLVLPEESVESGKPFRIQILQRARNANLGRESSPG